MKERQGSNLIVLCIFLIWANIPVSLFQQGYVFGQEEQLPGSSLMLQQTQTVSPESIPESIPEIQSPQPSEDEAIQTVYEAHEAQADLGNTPPQIVESKNELQNKAPQEDTSQITGNEQPAQLATIPISANKLHEATAPEIQKMVLETIYEQPGLIETEWNDRITVLSKAELTVIIPEHTTIRKAKGNETVSLDALLLLPEVTENIEKTHTRQEPLPLEQDMTLVPEVITITNAGEVVLDPTEYIIPDETILDEIIPDEIIPNEIIPNETAPEIEFLQEGEQLPLAINKTEQSTQPPLEDTLSAEKAPLQEVFEFGLPGEHLLFSEPVTLSYAVPYPEGSRMEVLVQHAGDIAPGVHGLSTDNSTSCTHDGFATKGGNLTEVIGGKVTFLTCGASTFLVTYTGGASTPNFVDNGTKDYTGVVLTGVNFSTGSILADVDILIDFRPIDNESPTGPWGVTNCYPAEKSFLLIHPDGTQVQLANAGTYTRPTTTCPQAQILYDQSAASGIVGGAWNLTGQSRQPVGDLDTLNGKSPFGQWTLRMGDNTNADGVMLFGYTLTLKNIECGDGIISSGEVCDDANIENGDGCTASCDLEAGRECTGEPSACTPIPGPTGLRLHYDGSMTGALFQDISGSGFHGTNFNSVTTGNQNGETIMCFNGTTQYIERATNLVTAYPFTMSTWMKSNTTAGLHGVVSFARSNATNRMRNIEHNGTTIRQNAQNTTATYTNAATALTTTEWFLVTAVYNSATDRDIYINGLYDGTNTTNETYSSKANNRLNIGRFADSSPSNYYDGCVDDVRFYSSALSSGQVYTLYAKPATLTTSTTTSSSPLLTGTMLGVLDTITLTISGNIFTGTNNGDGTRTLNAGIITPALTNGSYPTTLTVTNPYDRSVTYESSFSVTLPISSGDYCIASPSSISFPSFTTEGYTQTGYTNSSGYFELIDSSGADSGYYTTLQITDLSGTIALIPKTDLARQSTGITLLSGTVNTGVTLGSAFSGYSVATGTVTFIKRDPVPNSSKIGTYGAILQLRISLPAYIKPDTYAGTITYTLYEN